MKGTKFEMENEMRAWRKKGISQYWGRRSMNEDCWVHEEEETSAEEEVFFF